MANIRQKEVNGKKGSWEARVRVNKRSLSRSFATKQLAQSWAKKVESGAVNPAEATPDTLFAEVVRQWLAKQLPDSVKRGEKPEGWDSDLGWLMSHSKAPRRELYRVRQLHFMWGERRVSEIERSAIEGWMLDLSGLDVSPQKGKKKDHYLYNGGEPKKYAASTRRKWFYTFKKLLDWHAAVNSYALPKNLYAEIDIPAAWEQERERRLEPGDEQRLGEAALAGYKNREVWPRLIGFALESGMRAQELLKASWGDVDLAHRNLRIPKLNEKTKKGRDVPLSKRAVAILEEMRGEGKAKADLLFPQWHDSNMLARAFRRLCHRAGIEDLKIHDLRHEATSRFFERRKLDSVMIMKITGHKSMDTLSRYFQMRKGTLHELMD